MSSYTNALFMHARNTYTQRYEKRTHADLHNHFLPACTPHMVQGRKFLFEQASKES